MVSLLYVVYHLNMRMKGIGHVGGALSITWWNAWLLICMITLVMVMTLWRRVTTFDPLKIYHTLEREIIERGMIADTSQGVLTTLASALGQCQSDRCIRSPHGSVQMSEPVQIDSTLLILLVHRAM